MTYAVDSERFHCFYVRKSTSGIEPGKEKERKRYQHRECIIRAHSGMVSVVVLPLPGLVNVTSDGFGLPGSPIMAQVQAAERVTG